MKKDTNNISLDGHYEEAVNGFPEIKSFVNDYWEAYHKDDKTKLDLLDNQLLKKK